MHKRWLVGWLAAVVAVLPAMGTAEVASSTVTYLQAQPQSAWVTMALAAAGASGIATDHLKSVSGTAVTDYAKAILALVAVGQNPRTFGNVDYVGQILAQHHDGQLGNPGSLTDDAWGILALRAAGLSASDAAVSETAATLRANQQADFGWGFAVGVGTDTNTTAAVLMALIEAGDAASSGPLNAGAGYLRAAQNADGGFPYARGGESDADSTAWVVWGLRKVGTDPATLAPAGANPLEFLQSLANADGSFSWMASSPGPNLFATHDAAIALSGATIPVLPAAPAAAGTFEFRLEGKSRSLCYAMLAGTTALDLLQAGRSACDYTIAGTDSPGMGFFLTQVNDEVASGNASWFLLVNEQPSSVGLSGAVLQPSDRVLVYYDADYTTPTYPDYDRPLRLELSAPVAAAGGSVTATVLRYTDNGWQPAGAGVTIAGTGGSAPVTGADGTVAVSLPNGSYTLWAEGPLAIRSPRVTLLVGGSVSRQVNLTVEVEQTNTNTNGSTGGGVAGTSIGLEVTPDALDFGRLGPGGLADLTVTVRNSGTVGLGVSAQVSGDAVFTDGVTLEAQPWRGFAASLATGVQQPVSVGLRVPVTYLGAGIKQGTLVFWAVGR